MWAQVRSGLRVVIHLTRPLGVRHVGEIAVLSPDGDGRPVVLPALTHDGEGGVRPGPGLALLTDVVPEARP